MLLFSFIFQEVLPSPNAYLYLHYLFESKIYLYPQLKPLIINEIITVSSFSSYFFVYVNSYPQIVRNLSR